MTLDARHVELIAASGPTIQVPTHYGGHPVGALLAETGVLQAAIHGIVAGHFDPRTVRAQVRRKRHASQHQHYVLARRCAQRRPELAVRLLQRAAAIAPESHILSAQAVLLDRLDRRSEARPLHAAAIRRTPSNGHAWIAYAHHLETGRDYAGAAHALRSAVPEQTGSMLLKVRVQQIHLLLRRHHLSWPDRLFGQLVAWIERSRWQASILRAIGARLH